MKNIFSSTTFSTYSENKISLEDDVSKLDFNQADQDKVAELIRKTRSVSEKFTSLN